MFSEKTVFIIGAGASVEAGLPTGEGLIPKITEFLEASHGGFREYVRYAPMLPESNGDRRQNTAMMEAAAKRIAKGIHGSFSIDNFIDENRDDKFVEAVGKLAIAKTILDAEKASKMMVDASNIYNTVKLSNLRGTWYTKLSSLLFEGCTLNEVAERLSRVTFIIFNYDRCMEHYLFWALRLTYGLTNQDAANLLANVTIYHPYGQVGGLPFFVPKGSMPVYFGNPDPYAVEIWQVAKGIKTFTEGTTSAESSGLQAEVLASNMVIFLGFAFHNLNMAVLEASSINPIFDNGSKAYFGTVFGRSKSDKQLLERRVKSMCEVVAGELTAELADCTCADLFNEYHATFAMDRPIEL